MRMVLRIFLLGDPMVIKAIHGDLSFNLFNMSSVLNSFKIVPIRSKYARSDRRVKRVVLNAAREVHSVQTGASSRDAQKND